eukprot:TRINITY_DN12877_c0_g1_i1.p3 TRINITY_DN12877_c0_g1~~TRINITY_DN12877_c0_g1_i1.p3  ORF type:complete len:109 (-),score=11.83 TRINITY_DN12877_c0_g1_i1:233-559(-)
MNECSKCHLSNVVPKIPLYGAYNRRLEFGKTYKWCRCGRSTTQPFCDEVSHEGTGLRPLEFTVDRQQTMFSLCGCKYTRTPPYCDAFHTKLPFEPTEPPCTCKKVPDW